MSPSTPPHSPIVADLSHVTLRYDSGAQALEDMTLQVRGGERLCVLGANGSGKSTLASVLCGLLAPDEGRVTLAEEDVFDASRAEPIDFGAYRRARRELGLVFQNPDDQLITTVVEEDVAFGPENLQLPPHEIGLRVERELRRVAMQAFAKADPTRLSGGQKQRVAIAGALAMEPSLLVLDEPGSLLDVRGRSAIMRVMGRLHGEGTTIVHITHFMEEALAADRVIVLDRGRIVLEGTPDEVFAQASTLERLGLEEPFVARLAHGLGFPLTCDEDALVRAIAARSSGFPQDEAPADILPAGVASLGNSGISPRPDAVPHMGGANRQPTSHGSAAQQENTPQESARNVSNPPNTSHAGAGLEALLRVEHVSFGYQNDQNALDDVSLDVMREESVAIVGQTGSGKSTLLRLLCALEVPDRGRVLVNGVCTARKRDRRRLHGTIGYVMQHPERQLFASTVWEDVAFGPQNLGLSASEVQDRCAFALELVGLTGLDGASPFELSGGQQRLCAIAGILAMRPTILLLDEPTAGLDPRGRSELWRILDDLRAHGVTLVQVTHSMDDAARADHVVVLNQASILLQGTPAEVFCPANEDLLASAGLGLPQALSWALRLEQAGLPSVGNPLTLDDLAASIALVSPRREQPSPTSEVTRGLSRAATDRRDEQPPPRREATRGGAHGA